ncbi:phage tail spike protein [Neobacillus vireti]|uniref:phage tail spike protein n=1 Tax=Neobacillus vireti TaxID=220686 RepID=UPI003000C54A
MYTIDYTKKPQQISMFLAKPNRTIIGKIAVAQGITQTIRFGQVNDLSFSIPYDIVRDGQLVRNHIADLVREKFLIKVVVGTVEEWYTIIKKTKSMNETDSIRLECYSLPYELKYKKLVDYKATSYNCLQVLEESLKDTNWSVGYINAEFLTKWRSFDESSTTKLDFIFKICETFKGIPTFDTVNRKISIWKEDEISQYKGFWISYGKYLEMIEDTVSVDEIVTRLIVTSTDNATINTVNPTGKNYIDDFSYFLFPFERDSNRNVLTSSYFMSDELCHALLDYNQLLNQNENTFADLLKVRKSLESTMTQLNTDLLTLNTELQTILDDIEVAKKQGADLSELNKQRDTKQTFVDTKQEAIDNQQVKLDKNSDDISALNELLKLENNFTADLLAELNDYIQVEEWSDDNQISDEDYFYAASDYLGTVSIPPVNLNMSIINFFDIVEEQHNWSRMGIGDIIRVKHPKLGIDVKTKITEITFNYEEGSIGLTISNTKRPESTMKKFQDTMYKIHKLDADYNKRKRNWEAVATNFNTSNDRIKKTPNIPKNVILSHKDNDNGSVNLTLSWSYLNYQLTKDDADNIDGFIIQLYASDTNEKYVFGSNIAEESVYSVSYDKKSFTFPSISSNRYYTVGIKAYRNVDDDIAKEGTLFSKIITNPPYIPNPKMIIKGELNGNVNGDVKGSLTGDVNGNLTGSVTGNVNGNLIGNVEGNVTGKLNGVTHTVSDTEPLNPEKDDIWFYTTGNTYKRYDGSEWISTTVEEAKTLNGKTSADFVSINDLGSLTDLTTSDKNSITGAINEQNSTLQIASKAISGTLAPKPFSKGTVTFTYDDGLTNHYLSAYLNVHKTRNVPMAIAPHILSVLRSLSGNLTYSQMKEMYESGLVEICSHTMVHTKLDATVSEERVDWELRASKELLRKIGFDPKVFVAPVSAYDKSGNKLNILTSLYNAGYVGYKDATVTPVSELCFKHPVDIYSLYRANVNCGVAKAKELIDYAEANNAWITFYCHDISASGDIIESDLIQIVEYAMSKNVDILNPISAIDKVSTRFLGKERVSHINEQAINLKSRGIENQLSNARFLTDVSTTSVPSAWTYSSTFTGTKSNSVLAAENANVFQISLSGDNTDIGENGILSQTINFNGGLVDYFPLCMSIDVMALTGFNDAQFKMKITPKKADGTPLYEIEKLYKVWDRYQTIELANVIPNDSTITQITIEYYAINNKVANAVTFRMRKPKVEFGATKRSPWCEGKALTVRGYNRVFSNNTPTIPENVHTVVAFNNPSTANTGITYDSVTGRFTVPRKGYYNINAQISFATINDGSRLLASIYKNGVRIFSSQSTAGASENAGVSTNATIDCNANDYIEIYAYWKRKTGDVTEAATVTLNATPYTWATIVEL